MTSIETIQFVGGLLLFLSKVFLTPEKNLYKKIGWWLNFVGLWVFLYLVWIVQFWVMIGSHFGGIAMSLFGVYMLHAKEVKISKKQVIRVKVFIVGVTLILCFFLAYQTYATGKLTNWQFAHAFTGMMGALFLAFGTKTSSTLGWVCNILAHLCCIYYMSVEGLFVFVGFQILSICVCPYALWRLHFKKPVS